MGDNVTSRGAPADGGEPSRGEPGAGVTARVLTGSPIDLPAAAASALDARLRDGEVRSVPEADDAAVRAALDRAAKAGCRHLILSDGDPLERSEILEWLKTARALGFRNVEARTAGRVLAQPRAAATLRAAGLSSATVLLAGASAEEHDWVVGREGAFAIALRGLR